MPSFLQKLTTKEARIAVVGLGYVGLPLAVAFGRLYSVIGFDISTQKIADLSRGVDTTGELTPEDLALAAIRYTHSATDLADAKVIIVTVPTPIDSHKRPNLFPLESASALIGPQMTPGTVIVYESTVYPGVTEEVCIPILEKTSGLTCGKDFTVGYSPERLSPGDKNHSLAKIVKVVSASTSETLALLSELYGSIIPAGIHQAPSIKVAEAAKVIENTQRDLNVALMNELSVIFHKLGINTLDVIDAAATKWNFIKMTPGLVGGHCIGVDPYYLTYKAEDVGYHPEVILAGRRLNDGMGKYIAEQTIKQLIKADKPVKGAKVLVMGITFKENVSDIRNSKVVDIIHELEEYGVRVLVTDPLANPADTLAAYGVTLTDVDAVTGIDAVVIAVPHRAYGAMSLAQLYQKISGNNNVVMDIKGLFRTQDSAPDPFYWTL